MAKQSKSKPQRNEAVITISLILVLFCLGIFTYIVAGHSCSGMSNTGTLCEYKEKADANLGGFPQYTAWLEQNFHSGWAFITQKLHG